MLCRQSRVSDPKMLQIVGRFLLVLIFLIVSLQVCLSFKVYSIENSLAMSLITG